jgi:hypothetical protein
MTKLAYISNCWVCFVQMHLLQIARLYLAGYSKGVKVANHRLTQYFEHLISPLRALTAIHESNFGYWRIQLNSVLGMFKSISAADKIEVWKQNNEYCGWKRESCCGVTFLNSMNMKNSLLTGLVLKYTESLLVHSLINNAVSVALLYHLRRPCSVSV